jgi:hypothetical protein
MMLLSTTKTTRQIVDTWGPKWFAFLCCDASLLFLHKAGEHDVMERKQCSRTDGTILSAQLDPAFLPMLTQIQDVAPMTVMSSWCGLGRQP